MKAKLTTGIEWTLPGDDRPTDIEVTVMVDREALTANPRRMIWEFERAEFALGDGEQVVVKMECDGIVGVYFEVDGKLWAAPVEVAQATRGLVAAVEAGSPRISYGVGNLADEVSNFLFPTKEAGCDS